MQMLPKSIGKLQNLETLDLKRSLVSELPTEIGGFVSYDILWLTLKILILKLVLMQYKQ